MNKSYQLGQTRAISGNVAESRIISFVLSTPTKDRHNTVLNQNNWELKNYLKNPIVGYQHQLFGDALNPPDPDNIIGKCVKIGTEIINGSRCLVGSCEFETKETNPKAEKIFRKALFGSLKACSVGFIEIGQGKYGQGKEAKGAENETYYFAGQELLEWSLVHIPSNSEAGARQMSTLKDNAYGAIIYASNELGYSLRRSQIEKLQIRDVLDLLEGKDMGILTGDPIKVRQAIRDKNSDQAFKTIRNLPPKEAFKALEALRPIDKTWEACLFTLRIQEEWEAVLLRFEKDLDQKYSNQRL